jgi:8-oxo-dGTP pyrophosphatase MutT (NUDIX family)
VYQGRTYGNKDVEFARFESLPQRTRAALELAVSGRDVPWERLAQAGWRTLDANRTRSRRSAACSAGSACTERRQRRVSCGRVQPLAERVRSHLTRHARHEHALDGRLHAAVAAVLLPDGEGRPCFVLTRRASRPARHAGQWALPGGRLDPGEAPEAAALRECAEEIGLALPPAAVLGRLDDYATRSGFVITPVVVWSARPETLRPDPREVAELHLVPLAELDRPGVPHLRRIPESERPVLSIPLVGTHIHAPTAAILFQLREVAVWGRSTRVAHYEQPLFAWR